MPLLSVLGRLTALGWKWWNGRGAVMRISALRPLMQSRCSNPYFLFFCGLASLPTAAVVWFFNMPDITRQHLSLAAYYCSPNTIRQGRSWASAARRKMSLIFSPWKQVPLNKQPCVFLWEQSLRDASLIIRCAGEKTFDPSGFSQNVLLWTSEHLVPTVVYKNWIYLTFL